MPQRQGSIRLVHFLGIDVFLHWSWFLVAVFEIQSRKGRYAFITWNILEYLALFSIVLLHEFGHALACRQVGGKADQIVLWPLGGVAYVNPPQRPGATLWSIAAAIATPADDIRAIVDDLMQLNSLPNAGLRAGQQILVPAAG